MKPRGPLMIEHRLIEKMLAAAKTRAEAISPSGYDPVTVETIVGKNLARCKVVDVEDGKLVLDNGTRREWRIVEPVVICDRQDKDQQHEAGKEEGEHDREIA